VLRSLETRCGIPIYAKAYPRAEEELACVEVDSDKDRAPTVRVSQPVEGHGVNDVVLRTTAGFPGIAHALRLVGDDREVNPPKV